MCLRDSLLKGIFGAIAVLFALPVPAAIAKDLKIGVVNMQRAVSETEEGKATEKKLQALKDRMEAELNRKLKEFYQEEEKLQKSWTLLKEADRQKKAADRQQKQQMLQKQYLEAERELMKKKTDAFLEITKKLGRIIEKIAARDGLDYIFANEAVLWAPRHVDLTNDVIRQYNGTKK